MSGAGGVSVIDEVLQDAVERGAVPHVAAIAANCEGVVFQGSAGPRSAGERDPISVHTVFRLMSMTKLLCTVAALQQIERGELDLGAPVADFCPDFATLQVLASFDADTPRLRSPARQATVKDLVTHTSGLGYGFWNDQLLRWHKATGTPSVASGLRASFTAPLLADSGEAFIYGTGIDWLGMVVEAVTGSSLDVAIRRGVTGPLGMDRTSFLMNDDQRAKSAPVHVRGQDGMWVPIGEILNQVPDWWSGGHGLYGPPSDYIKLQQALLRGGELNGTRILQQSTLDAAFTNQIGSLDFPAEIPTADPAVACTFQAGPGLKWGFGLLLNTCDIPGMRRAWSGGWAGLCNTYFWIDRATGICASIYSNFLPFATPEAIKLYNDFERALYTSL